MDDLFLRALVGACLLAITLGPLGVFVVWRQMAYFGDTIAHSALLGVALSLLSGGVVPMPLAILGVAVSVALILTRYSRNQRFQADTMLGILAHSALALGILLVALSHSITVDINAYLFGDILGISWREIATLAGLGAGILLLVARHWRGLLMATIEPNIAAVEGVNVGRMHLLLTLMLAAVIALTIKLTGVLLITALLIIPAAAARSLATSPRHMAVLASVMGVVSASTGLFASIKLDAPTGPTMVVAAAAIFVLSSLLHRRA